MANVKREGGTYKGLIGEILFAMSHTRFLLPRFHPKLKYLPRMTANRQQKAFLDINWYSIDAVSWDGKDIIEVKTRNRYAVQLPYKPKSSEKTLQLLQAAMELGFKVSIATVWLEENWNFNVEIEPFELNKLSKDSAKNYDAGALSEDG